MNKKQVSAHIFQILSEVADMNVDDIKETSQLIGQSAIIKSRELIEFLVAVEEYADEQLDVEFDWTSDSAMSEMRSIFRTVGSLTDHVYGLIKK